MNTWLSLEDVYLAYRECRKRKRNTVSCALFEANEAENLVKLWKELNNGTYKIGYSIAFCVTRPKLREVFAANFRDRIVHHLLINKLGYLFEEYFIDDTYNCRVGKGNLKGALALKEKIEQKDCWILKCDLLGFFMSIDKLILANKLHKFINERYHYPDKPYILNLVNMVVMHKPQDLCFKRGDVNLWKSLPKNKSLFTCKLGKGLAIGNLTSQIFANFYLSEFDHKIVALTENNYCRYVDDLAIVGPKEKLLKLLPYIRGYLSNNLKVTLHPNKVYLLHQSKGVSFIGITIKNKRTYCNNRTVYNAFRMIEAYNTIAHKYKGPLLEFAEKFMLSYNSYMGFMIHHYTYAIRYRLWNKISSNLKLMLETNKSHKVIHVKEEFTNKTKLILEYEQNKYSSRRICSIGTCTLR